MTYFDPPSMAPLPAARHDAMRRQLTTMVATRRQTRRPLLIVGTTAAIAIGTSAGAYAYVQHSAPVTGKSQAYCYTVDTLAGGYFTTIAAGPPGSSKTTQVADALSACGDFWRQGILRAGDRNPVPPGHANGIHPVPPLVACVLPDGTAAVFPGPASTCTALGLPSALKH
jgi:hypothetical protein